jgi:hypothetical protein
LETRLAEVPASVASIRTLGWARLAVARLFLKHWARLQLLRGKGKGRSREGRSFRLSLISSVEQAPGLLRAWLVLVWAAAVAVA